MSLPELKPCPFRHKQTGKYHVTSNAPDQFFVECGECGAGGPTAESPQKAVNAWNRGRHPDLTTMGGQK